MPSVLIVEDSPDQALTIAAMLKGAGFDAHTAKDGVDALEAIGKHRPDVVLTDLIMPRMNGLELVEALTKQYRAIPVILMTAYGSGEIAMQALKAGAASYVSKNRIAQDILDTVNNTLQVSQARREQARVLDSLRETEFRFELDNDQSLIYPLIGYLKEAIVNRVGYEDESQLTRLGIALHEALLNAMHHGNLAVSSELREQDINLYLEQVEQRRSTAPFRDRRVELRASISPVELRCVIQDQGEGFDPAAVPDPTDPANLEKPSGRGLYLIMTFMDEVRHNESGNCITMVKRIDAAGPGGA